jgi:hypothetical protein
MDKLARVMFLLLCHVTSITKQIVFYVDADDVDEMILGLNGSISYGMVTEEASEARDWCGVCAQTRRTTQRVWAGRVRARCSRARRRARRVTGVVCVRRRGVQPSGCGRGECARAAREHGGERGAAPGRVLGHRRRHLHALDHLPHRGLRARRASRVPFLDQLRPFQTYCVRAL